MTRVRIEPGICGFTTTVTADTNEDEEVVLRYPQAVNPSKI